MHEWKLGRNGKEAWMDGRTEVRYMDGWKDGGLDAWMDGRTEG